MSPSEGSIKIVPIPATMSPSTSAHAFGRRSRNTTLLRLAGHLIANPLLDPYVARDLLLGWNRSMCEPPLPDARVIQIVEGLCEREKQKERWL